MPLDMPKVEAAVNAVPYLCAFNIAEWSGPACVMGALLMGAGVSRGTLRAWAAGNCADSGTVWSEWGDLLRDTYGFTAARQVSQLVFANDDGCDAMSRKQAVLDVARDL